MRRHVRGWGRCWQSGGCCCAGDGDPVLADGGGAVPGGGHADAGNCWRRWLSAVDPEVVKAMFEHARANASPVLVQETRAFDQILSRLTNLQHEEGVRGDVGGAAPASGRG